MFEKGSFYEIRSSVESLAYPKSVMFFTVCAMIGKDNFELWCACQVSKKCEKVNKKEK